MKKETKRHILLKAADDIATDRTSRFSCNAIDNLCPLGYTALRKQYIRFYDNTFSSEALEDVEPDMNFKELRSLRLLLLIMFAETLK